MSRTKSKTGTGTKTEVPFVEAVQSLADLLDGTTRHDIRNEVLNSKSVSETLTRLRHSMQTHVFERGPTKVDLSRVVVSLDRQTRKDGFHVLRDWDGQADRLYEETIPVNVVDFLMDMTDKTLPDESKETTVSILLDYYLFYLLALLAMRIWEGDADQNLDQVEHLLSRLQSDAGSGQRFVANAETLILIATAHFESDENAFERLLGRVRELNRAHRTRLAAAHAGILSSHLRFGFRATYGRDLSEMRNDNGPDYPWLLFALTNLTNAYRRARESDRACERGELEREEQAAIVEALLNGLSPDPRAFLGNAPPSLDSYREDLDAFRSDFETYGDEWAKVFEDHRPNDVDFSPLSLFFNFPHNVLKAVVVDAILRGEPWRLSINDLLTAFPREKNTDRKALAETLMGYARQSPDRIRGRLTPAIVYDPSAGRRTFTDTLKRLGSS